MNCPMTRAIGSADRQTDGQVQGAQGRGETVLGLESCPWGLLNAS